MGKTRYITTEVEVRLDDFDTEDLVKELTDRNYKFNTEDVDGEAARDILQQIWHNRRCSKPYQQELDQLIYKVLGKVI